MLKKNPVKKRDRVKKKWDSSKFWTKNQDSPSKRRTVREYESLADVTASALLSIYIAFMFRSNQHHALCHIYNWGSFLTILGLVKLVPNWILELSDYMHACMNMQCFNHIMRHVCSYLEGQYLLKKQMPTNDCSSVSVIVSIFNVMVLKLQYSINIMLKTMYMYT